MFLWCRSQIPCLGNDMLDNLPSRILYKKFENKEGKDKCDTGKVNDGRAHLKSTLGDYNCVGDCIEKVMSAWCYINGNVNENNSLSYDEFHNLFYSWLGEELRMRIAGESSRFENIAKNVHGALERMHDGKECEDMCKDIYLKKKQEDDDGTFEHIKLLAEYFTDSKKLKEQLGNDSTEKKCEEAYDDHLKQIKNACKAIGGKCSNGSRSEEYCKWFHKHNKINEESGDKKYCDQTELDKLTCTPVKWVKSSASSGYGYSTGNQNTGSPRPSSVSSSARDASAGGSGGGVGGMVGGGLVSVALPTIGFFLYKYTDVFDGIKKSLFGGLNNRNRGRRSIGRRQHFDDTFTENDSSTLGHDGSTLGDGSTTLGGESSTLGGSSTDISTIYNDDDDGERRRRPSPPRRTRVTNNRRPENIRYYAT
eukprot:XP_002258352.1 KIR protein [Plasmodium knowlesi strain H]